MRGSEADALLPRASKHETSEKALISFPTQSCAVCSGYVTVPFGFRVWGSTTASTLLLCAASGPGTAKGSFGPRRGKARGALCCSYHHPGVSEN